LWKFRQRILLDPCQLNSVLPAFPRMKYRAELALGISVA
jgi:hypothetical protein